MREPPSHRSYRVSRDAPAGQVRIADLGRQRTTLCRCVVASVYPIAISRSTRPNEESLMSSIHAGVSRRSFMRILGAASAAATSFPALAAVQQGAAAAPAGQGARRGPGGMSDMGEMRQLSPDTVIISSNENPLGPAQSALQAI